MSSTRFDRVEVVRRRCARTSFVAVGAILLTALLAASAPALNDRSGAPVPNTSTGGTAAQLVAGPDVTRLLAAPTSPGDDDPVAVAKLGSVGGPEDDLDRALATLASATDASAAGAARQLALDILEGNPLPAKAYNGMPLLNWNAPAKVKVVPPGGNVLVREARFGQHTLTDTSLLSFDDPTQPFSITFRIAELEGGTDIGGQLAPTPLLEDNGVPIGGLHSVLTPLVLPETLTGTTESSRFHPTGANEHTRLGEEDVTVRMPPPRLVSALLEPNLRAGRANLAAVKSLATIEPATPARLDALAAAFGFGGSTPTAAEKLAAIGRLGDTAPEKQLWNDLRRLDPAAPTFLADAAAIGTQDRALVTSMRTRTQIPPGVVTDPTSDVTVALVNDEAYISPASVHITGDAPLKVTVANQDGFAHSVQALQASGRKQALGTIDWGQFDWAPLDLGGGTAATLAAGTSRTFTITPAADSFALWIGDRDSGDQAAQVLSLDRDPPRQSFAFHPDFAHPDHEAIDAAGNVWVTLGGVDKIVKLTPGADLAASAADEYLLPNGDPDVATGPKWGPHDIAVDARGIVWATLADGNAIARLDPALAHPGTTDGITIYPLAACTATACAPPAPGFLEKPPTRKPEQAALMEDAAGNTVLWFSELDANAIGVLVVAPDGTVRNQADIPCGCTEPKGIALGSDGVVWFTERQQNRLGRLRPGQTHPYLAADAQFDHFQIPSFVTVVDPAHPVAVSTSEPHSIAIDGEGRVWFTEEGTGKVGFLDPALAHDGTTDGFTEFALGPNAFGAAVAPADIAVDRANTVYFTDEYGDNVGTATAAGPGRSFRPAERASLPDKPLVDANGNLWFVESGSGLVTRISGVTAGAPLPGAPPAFEANTSDDTLTGQRLREIDSVDVAVLRRGTVVAHADGVAVTAGAFAVGGTGAAWASSTTDPLRAGDRVRVTPHAAFPRASFSFVVATLAATVQADGSVAGRARSGGTPLADTVALQLPAASAEASIDPTRGCFRYVPTVPLAPSTIGSVSWAGATVAGVFRTVTRFTPGLVAAYSFDDGSGTTLGDSSGNCNDGAVQGGAAWTAAGRSGGALSFDGVDDSVTVPDAPSLDLTDGMTLEAWVKPDTLGSMWRAAIVKEQTNALAYALYAHDGTAAARPSGHAFIGTELTLRGNEALPVGVWTHLALTYDNDRLRLYVNGALATSMGYSGNLAVSNGPLRIGGNDIWPEWFSGLLDEIRVYNRALTSAEIQTDMTTPVDDAPAADATPPSGAITAPAAGATVAGTVAVSASAADDTGVAGVQFKLDGANLGAEDTGAPYSVSWNSKLAANGAHTLSAVVRDFAGNTTTASAITVTVANDLTPPTVALTAPAAGATVSGTAVALAATASDNVGVASVQFRLDGANIGARLTAAPYTITWNASTTANGVHTLTAVARDAAGNATTSAAVSVTVANDVTPPAVALTAPAAGATLQGGVSISANASDNVGVAGVQFKVDGVNVGAEVTTAPYAVSWNSTTATNGAHTLTAVARDAAGNATTSAAVTVTLANDKTAPTVALTAPAAGATVQGTGVSISADASDNVGVAGVQFKVDGVNVGGEVTTAPYWVSWNSTTASNGAHTLTAVARDAAGNATTSTAVTVTLANDKTAPTVALTAPAAGATVQGTAVSISANASDNVGVAGVQFKVDGVNVGGEVATAPYSVSWNSTTVANGAHTLTAVARDAAGNTATAAAVTVTVSNAAPPPPPPPPPGPVAAYGFNEGTGTAVADASGTGNAGTIAGATWSVAGKFGGALSFDGATSSVKVADSASLHLTTGMTLEAWVNPSALGTTWRTVIFKEQTAGMIYSLYANDGAGHAIGQVFIGAEQPVTGTGALPLNAWTHLAVTYDGATLRLYVNGVLNASAPVAGPITTSTGVLRIGGNGVWPEWFAGLIDEVRIYNRPLSAGEIQTDMTTAVGGAAAAPTPAPDTTAPTVALTAPAAAATVSGTAVAVSANASDNVGVAGVQFKLDGANLGAEDTTAPYSTTWNTTLAAAGAHTLTAVARDAAGNTTTSAPVTVTVSNGP